MIQIWNNKGVMQSYSRNLRGIHERVRRSCGEGLSITVGYELVGSGCVVFLKWAGGDWAGPYFADRAVAIAWARSRRFNHATVDIKPAQTIGTSQ